MTINPRDTNIQTHGKHLYLPWEKGTTKEWMHEKDYMSLVTEGTHISNLKPKIGLRELTMGKNSNMNP